MTQQRPARCLQQKPLAHQSCLPVWLVLKLLHLTRTPNRFVNEQAKTGHTPHAARAAVGMCAEEAVGWECCRWTFSVTAVAQVAHRHLISWRRARLNFGVARTGRAACLAAATLDDVEHSGNVKLGRRVSTAARYPLCFLQLYFVSGFGSLRSCNAVSWRPRTP